MYESRLKSATYRLSVDEFPFEGWPSYSASLDLNDLELLESIFGRGVETPEPMLHPKADRGGDAPDPAKPSEYSTAHSAGLSANLGEYSPSATPSHTEYQEGSCRTDPIAENPEDGYTPFWSKTLQRIPQPHTCNIRNRGWPSTHVKVSHSFWEIAEDQIPFLRLAPTGSVQYETGRLD